jgi:hypothetical protein
MSGYLRLSYPRVIVGPNCSTLISGFGELSTFLNKPTFLNKGRSLTRGVKVTPFLLAHVTSSNPQKGPSVCSFQPRITLRIHLNIH